MVGKQKARGILETFEFQAAYEVVRPVRKVAKIVVAKRSFVNIKTLLKRSEMPGFSKTEEPELRLVTHIRKGPARGNDHLGALALF